MVPGVCEGSRVYFEGEPAWIIPVTRERARAMARAPDPPPTPSLELVAPGDRNLPAGVRRPDT
jgi:hypothetical protein